MTSLARILIFSGLLLIAAGCVVFVFQRLGGNGFRMPGDVVYQRKNFTFSFPVVTCLAASVVLSLLFYLFQKFFKH